MFGSTRSTIISRAHTVGISKSAVSSKNTGSMDELGFIKLGNLGTGGTKITVSPLSKN